jgi:Uma2 family endonuclease
MVMAPATTVWTVEQVDQLPEDGNRYEVIHGRLFVSPSPSMAHQILLQELDGQLWTYLRAHPIGALFPAPTGVTVDATTKVEPDLFVSPLVAGRAPKSFPEAGALLLAIEVLSPSTMAKDRTQKRDLYLEMGIPEYWIVDPDAKAIERWRPGMTAPEILRERIEWRPDAEHPAWVVDLPELFSRIE